jgi:hydrogenase maturation protease
MRRVTVFVCGEPMRGDDAVGVAIADTLPATTARLAEIRVLGAVMPDDLVAADGPVIVVDAVVGPPPGELVDLPLATLAARPGPIGTASSHAIPLPAVIGLAQALTDGRLEGRFLGVAGGGWSHGAPLSPAVRAAVPVAVRHLAHWIRVLAHDPAVRVPSCA